MSLDLAGYQRRALRAAAHDLQPVAHVGKDGLSETFLRSVDEALAAHELIKVRFVDHKDERKEMAARLAERLDAVWRGWSGTWRSSTAPTPSPRNAAWNSRGARAEDSGSPQDLELIVQRVVTERAPAVVDRPGAFEVGSPECRAPLRLVVAAQRVGRVEHFDPPGTFDLDVADHRLPAGPTVGGKVLDELPHRARSRDARSIRPRSDPPRRTVTD